MGIWEFAQVIGGPWLSGSLYRPPCMHLSDLLRRVADVTVKSSRFLFSNRLDFCPSRHVLSLSEMFHLLLPATRLERSS